MADRRMFSKSIIDSDLFLDMPQSAQCLYFHLAMRADDDGFVNAPKKVQRMIGASEDDCRLLVAKQFIIPFETGVVVIKHWRIHNYIKKDRYKETIYQGEKSMLMSDKSGAYELMEPNRNHTGTVMDTQYRLGEESLGEDRSDKDSVDTGRKRRTRTEKPEKESYGEYGWVKLTPEEYTRLLSEHGSDKLNHAIKYIDELAQSTGNKNRWKDWNLVVRRAIREGWGKRNEQPKEETPKSFMDIANQLEEKGGFPWT